MTRLRRREFLGGAAGVGLTACVPAMSPITMSLPGTDRLEPLLSAMANEIYAEFPEAATYAGVDKSALAPLRRWLTDRTAAGRQALPTGARARLTRLRQIDISDLGKPFALDAAVALAAHELTDEGYRFPYGDVINLDPNFGYRNTPYVVNQMNAAYIELPDFLDGRHIIADADDGAAFADRVDAYARMIDGETERMAHDRGLGVIAPDFVLDGAIKIIDGGARQNVVETIQVKSIERQRGKAGEAAVTRVRATTEQAIVPALARQVVELKRHRALAKHDAGVWHIPDGDAYYRRALKTATTTSLTPQEIHQIGLDQVKVIQARMDTILRRRGMTSGTVGARMAALGKDPSQIYPNTAAGREQLLAYLDERTADIRARMPRAFTTLVPGKLVIKRVPLEIEAGAPGGYASAGTADGSVPGQYYINLRDTAEVPKFTLPTLTYHEAIPGHIWQGDYANRLPPIRSLLAFNAYSEGWALYAEQLADELGVYDDDPIGALGYLQANAFRCCRLVVDTGMHALRWSRERAIDWFVTTNGDDAASVTGEVERYAAWPGQACGYKVGEIAINRLRDKAKTSLGGRYDVRQFNDAVVRGGSVPMSLLDTVIDSYIARGRA